MIRKTMKTDAENQPSELHDAELDAVQGGSDEQKKRSLHIFTAKPSSDNDETRSANHEMSLV